MLNDQFWSAIKTVNKYQKCIFKYTINLYQIFWCIKVVCPWHFALKLFYCIWFIQFESRLYQVEYEFSSFKMYLKMSSPFDWTITVGLGYLPVKMFWNAVSTLVESRADVSMKDRLFFSENRNKILVNKKIKAWVQTIYATVNKILASWLKFQKSCTALTIASALKTLFWKLRKYINILNFW